MRTEQLEQFVRIVDEGSMSEAARKLFVSRSSLSSAMKNLELELGAPLFERVSKGVLLTPFGVDVYHSSIDILKRIGHLKESTGPRAKTMLNVAHMYNAAANDAFAEFCIRNNESTLLASVEETGLNGVVSCVAEGFAEVGIIHIFPNGEKITSMVLENNGLEFHQVAENTIFAVVGPKNPLYNRKSGTVKLEELAQYQMIEHYAAPTHQNMEMDLGYKGSVLHSGNIKVAELGLALYLVSTSDAVLLNGRSEVVRSKVFPTLDCRFLRIEDDVLSNKLGWVKSIHKELSPAAKEYIEIYEEKVREELSQK